MATEWTKIGNIQGPSAYDIAVSHGFVGTEAEWNDLVNARAAAAHASELAAAESAAEAAQSADDATQQATLAQTARTGAETARTGAETARAGVEDAETSAAQSATDATTQAQAAQTARTGSETARDASVAAQGAAETARTGAETARTGSEAARDITVAARDVTLTARDTTTAARDVTTGARDTTLIARDDAVTAKTASQTAQTAAETARTGAETARTGSEAARDAAASSAASAAGVVAGSSLPNGFPALLTNLAKNPVFNANTNEWAAVAGASTLTRLAQNQGRVSALAAVSNAAVYLQGNSTAQRYPITPGKYAHAAIKFTALRNADLIPRIATFDVAGATFTSIDMPKVSVVAGQTYTVGYVDQLTPVGAINAYLRVAFMEPGSAVAAIADYIDIISGAVYLTDQQIGWQPSEIPMVDGTMAGAAWSNPAAPHASTTLVKVPDLATFEALTGRLGHLAAVDPHSQYRTKASLTPNITDIAYDIWLVQQATPPVTTTGAIQVAIPIGATSNIMLEVDVELWSYDETIQKTTLRATCYTQSSNNLTRANVRLLSDGYLRNQLNPVHYPTVNWVRASGGTTLYLVIGNVTDVNTYMQAKLARISANYASLTTLGTPTLTTITTMPTGTTLTIKASDTPAVFRGTGSPEGVVAAYPGVDYIDTNQSSGYVKWTKATGTNTTGWAPVTGILPADPHPQYALENAADSATNGLKDYAERKFTGASGATNKSGALIIPVTVSGSDANMLTVEVDLHAYNSQYARATVVASIYYRDAAAGAMIGPSAFYSVTNQNNAATSAFGASWPLIRWARSTTVGLVYLVIGDTTDTWLLGNAEVNRVTSHYTGGISSVGTPSWVTTLPANDSIMTSVVADSSGVITGTGSPEGVVIANIGAEYIDRAATNGAAKWIKTSGTGATGWWSIAYGDINSTQLSAHSRLVTSSDNIVSGRTGAAVIDIPCIAGTMMTVDFLTTSYSASALHVNRFTVSFYYVSSSNVAQPVCVMYPSDEYSSNTHRFPRVRVGVKSDASGCVVVVGDIADSVPYGEMIVTNVLSTYFGSTAPSAATVSWVTTLPSTSRMDDAVVKPLGGVRGTGSPEGVISAPIGIEYVDLSATNGAVKWIKFSGTGNTGWRVIMGDTGWRDISSLLANGWTATAIHLRRDQIGTEMRFSNLSGAAATSDTILNLPTGFRFINPSGAANSTWYPPIVDATGTADNDHGVHFTSGNMVARYASPGTRANWILWATVWFPGNDIPWPTSLPGTAA